MTTNREGESPKCPKCGLTNPPGSLRCDCGYDFASGLRYIEPERPKPPKTRYIPDLRLPPELPSRARPIGVWIVSPGGVQPL